MEKITRIGISLEPELLKEFDALIKNKGYVNRSEAIRDLIRRELMEDRIKEGEGEVIGIIAFMYNHHEGNVAEKLLEVQHHRAGGSFTTHIHLDEEKCLEILIVRGKTGKIRSLAEHIKSIKGVKYGDFLMAAPDI